ncbi:hypothetical protein Y032_0012g1805 [Ancylostoma ceylanicum]|uniref:Uncharacterized protein n=1 Tax=Ancylostoma ceylanicum TaxID=53326 RepID=A0A016VCX5_9BILA|nr:hypothetical protein Y032_0012g1805 [Ancylostoma ceylanicum]
MYSIPTCCNPTTMELWYKMDTIRAIYTRCYSSNARIHLRKIFYEDRSTRHELLNEKKMRPSRGRKRVRLRCDSRDWPLFFILWTHARQSHASSINYPIFVFSTTENPP